MEPPLAALRQERKSIMHQLFSYGTLQQIEVQLETIGKHLIGRPDSVIGYIVTAVEIDNLEVIRISGLSRHPMVRYTGSYHHQVPGTVFEISSYELSLADAYEVASYQRVEANLATGGTAWVYVERSAQG